MIWNPTHQPRRIFGWRGILSDWARSGEPVDYVLTVLTNLRMATMGAVNYPLSHFLDFLNYEQEAIVWFLYEAIHLRHEEGKFRIDYVRELLDSIENLDTFFPVFPNHPSYTIREYLEDNLTAEQLSQIDIMPPLIPLSHCSHTIKAKKPASSPAKIEIFVIRNTNDKSKDDMIRISKDDDHTYSILFHDQDSGLKTTTSNMLPSDLMKYMSSTLRMLTVDSEPFLGVQFSMPNSPSVLITTENLTSQTRDLVYDKIEELLNCWPTTL